MSFFGKVFLFAALAGYSYLLFTDVTLGKQFDTKFAQFSKHSLVSQYVPADVFKHVTAQCARQAIGGLIGSSILLFVCGGFVVFPVLGLLLQIAILSNPVLSNDQHTQVEFLKVVALIGGLLLWASSNCCSKKVASQGKEKKE